VRRRSRSARSAERSHEPLVDDETFERVQLLMTSKGADPKRTHPITQGAHALQV
jgi:hypothetical protein